MTQSPKFRISRLIVLGSSATRVFVTFRDQIDGTKLFPDLSGDAGKALRQTVRDDGKLTKSYMLMCALAAGIATLGLLQSSTAVIIGAMLISPLMGPIASMGFGFASFDGHQIRDSMKVVAVGAVIGVLTGVLLTLLSPISNATPEIIARTEPTLLDLAVAIISGVAGAYATVQQKGTTAIGVAIATALMPPLATVGYGLGVANMVFAFGAFLLFLTNLAAIAFSFAAVARFSGAARPIANVEIAPRYIIAGLAGFAILATPLGVTLYRITAETKAQATVRRLLGEELKLKPANIAQLQVKWPLRGAPSVDAVVVSPRYVNDAELHLLGKLEAEWGERPNVNLQQVVAADVQAQTRAIVDAAVQTSVTGITQDTPPLIAIRKAIGLPTEALWVNRTERSVQIVPFAADGWELGDYRNAEKAAARASGGWRVQVIPPVQPHLFVAIALQDGLPQGSPELDDAIWAIDRWGVQDIAVAGLSGDNVSEESRAEALSMAAFVTSELKKSGIKASASVLADERLQLLKTDTPGIEFEVVNKPKRDVSQP